MSRIGALFLILLISTFLWGGALPAYSFSESIVSLDFRSDAVMAELVLPLSELETSFGQPLTLSPENVISRFGPSLEQYILDHIRLVSPDGRSWRISVEGLTLRNPGPSSTQLLELVASLHMHPPVGAPLRKFLLHDDVISREVTNYGITVMVRSDWNSALFPDQPAKMIGATSTQAIEIDQSGGNWWLGFASMIGLGFQSFAESRECLLFLLVLLVPVPLLVTKGRWDKSAGPAQAFRRLLKLIFTFTIGYLVAFLVIVLGAWPLPTKAADLLVALAVIVAAIHVVRPLSVRHEAVASMLFGVFYGMAFSTGLPSFILHQEHLLPAILAYAVGIEVMLLLGALLLMPSLILLSGSRVYPYVRIGVAAVALVVAIGWAVPAFSPSPFKILP